MAIRFLDEELDELSITVVVMMTVMEMMTKVKKKKTITLTIQKANNTPIVSLKVCSDGIFVVKCEKQRLASTFQLN